MYSPIYQYVIDPVVSLPIRRLAGVFMNVLVREHRALNQTFHVTMFSILTALALLS
jgi:hypothetical protein